MTIEKTLFGAPRPERPGENKWARLSQEELDVFQVLLDFVKNPTVNTPGDGRQLIFGRVKFPDTNKMKDIMEKNQLGISDLPQEVYSALVDTELLSLLEPTDDNFAQGLKTTQRER